MKFGKNYYHLDELFGMDEMILTISNVWNEIKIDKMDK